VRFYTKCGTRWTGTRGAATVAVSCRSGLTGAGSHVTERARRSAGAFFPSEAQRRRGRKRRREGGAAQRYTGVRTRDYARRHIALHERRDGGGRPWSWGPTGPTTAGGRRRHEAAQRDTVSTGWEHARGISPVWVSTRVSGARPELSRRPELSQGRSGHGRPRSPRSTGSTEAGCGTSRNAVGARHVCARVEHARHSGHTRLQAAT